MFIDIEYTIEKQHAVVRFLREKGLLANDIYKELFPVYIDKCLSRKNVHKWFDKFFKGLPKL